MAAGSAQVAADVDAIEVRQAQVEQGHIRLLDRREVERLPRRRRCPHAIPPGLEAGGQHAQERRLVVDDEDVAVAAIGVVRAVSVGQVSVTPDGG
jgi:hypothetical protein